MHSIKTVITAIEKVIKILLVEVYFIVPLLTVTQYVKIKLNWTQYKRHTECK